MKTEHEINLEEVPEGFWSNTLEAEDLLGPSRESPKGGWTRGDGRLSPVYALMKAMLEDVVRCLLSTSAGLMTQRRDDMDWLESKATNHPLSFENICLEFGLDPSYVRSNLLKLVKSGKGGQRRVRIRDNVYTRMTITARRYHSRRTSLWAYTTGAKLSVQKRNRQAKESADSIGGNPD